MKVPGGAPGTFSAVTGYRVNGSSKWLKSHGFCTIPEQVLLSVVPGQPPLWVNAGVLLKAKSIKERGRRYPPSGRSSRRR